MKTGEAGLALIREFEGLRLRPYRCPAGYLTVGFGHRVQRGEEFGELTREEAEALMLRDLVPVEASLTKHLTAKLEQHEHDALASWLFNVGPHALRASQIRGLVNDGKKAEVPSVLRRWTRAKQAGKLVELPGLVRRREAEIAVFCGVGEV